MRGASMNRKQKRIIKKMMRWCEANRITLAYSYDEGEVIGITGTPRSLLNLALNLVFQVERDVDGLGFAESAERLRKIAAMIYEEDKVIMAEIKNDEPPDTPDRFKPSMN